MKIHRSQTWFWQPPAMSMRHPLQDTSHIIDYQDTRHDHKRPQKIDPVRDHSLDGLRGWAVMAVVLYHFVKTDKLWATLFKEDDWNAFKEGPLYVTMDGPRAVHVLFVISGKVLVASFLEKNSGNVAAAIVRRPFRLVVPVIMSMWVVQTSSMSSSSLVHSQMERH